MNILALDLGTKTGWAICTPGGTLYGTESFAPRSKDGPGQRWLKFHRFLIETRARHGDLHAVYYEDVKAHGSRAVYAAHVYGGFLALLQAWAETNRVQIVGVGVGQVKKHWTGKGNARKDAMIDEAKRRGFAPKDDNTADALAILSLAQSIEGTLA